MDWIDTSFRDLFWIVIYPALGILAIGLRLMVALLTAISAQDVDDIPTNVRITVIFRSEDNELDFWIFRTSALILMFLYQSSHSLSFCQFRCSVD